MPPISSAGKVLSGTNKKILIESLSGLLKVLKAEGSDSASIMNLVRQAFGMDAPGEEPPAEGTKYPLVTPTEVEAGRLSDNVRVTTWFDTVSRAIVMFRENFISLYRMSDSQVEREYGAGIARQDVAEEAIGDLTQLLNEYKNSFPGKGEESYYYYPGSHYDGFYASARKTDEVSQPPAPVPEAKPEPVVEPEPEPIKAEADDNAVPVTIVAAGRAGFNIVEINSEKEKAPDNNIEFFLEFNPSSVREIIAVKQQSNANTVPFEGVLFIIDEPSESAPSKGSMYPLYVPMSVAIEAAEALNASPGLPLDVDDTLSCHSDTNIVGIMNSAEIRGNEFVVKGHLFARNQGEKVSLIANNKETLGMSMNAFASGAVQKIDNVTAYSISTLELLGANILLADKATWQKTRVLAAQASATTADLTHSPDLEMDLEKLSEQITSLTASLNNVATNQQQDREQFQNLLKRVEQQGEVLTAQAQFIQEIAAERKQAAVEAQSKEQQEQQQQTQQQIAELVSNAVSTQFDSFQKAVLDRINPSRSPVGLTTRPPGLTPVVASGAQDSGNSTDIKLSPMQYELLQAQSQLAGMERSRHTGSDRVKLIEQCRTLKAQGVVLPSGMSPHQSLLTALV